MPISSLAGSKKMFDSGFKRKAADSPIYIYGKRIKIEVDEYEELPEPDFNKITTENLVIHLMERVRELETALYGAQRRDESDGAFGCENRTMSDERYAEIVLFSDSGEENNDDRSEASCAFVPKTEPQEWEDSDFEAIDENDDVVREDDEKSTKSVDESKKSTKSADENEKSTKSVDENEKSTKSVDENEKSTKSVDENLAEEKEQQDHVVQQQVEEHNEDTMKDDNDKKQFETKPPNVDDDNKEGIAMPCKMEITTWSFDGDLTSDSDSDFGGETTVVKRNLKSESVECNKSSGLLRNLSRFFFRK